jgi:hypothetical protein
VLACLALSLAGAAGGSPPGHRIAGIVPPFGKAPHTGGSSSARGCHGPSRPECGLLRYGGGPVMHQSTVYTIFWLPTGYTSWDGEAPYSAAYQGLIAQFFQDLQADSGLLTNVYGTDAQYCGAAPIGLSDCEGVPAANHITTDVTYGGTYTDTQAFPASGCDDPFGEAAHCLTDAQLIDEIQHAIGVNGWTASATNMFFIYTPRGVQTCVDDGGPFGTCAYNFYCAYHSNVGSGSNALIYANMAYPLFGDEDVCRDAEDVQQPNGDIADAVLSTTSHEHAEAITDPEPPGGWLDAEDFTTGGENGDKCAYYYGKPTGRKGSRHNQVINGHPYYLQLEWSNADHDCSAASELEVTKLSPSHGVVGQPVQILGTGLDEVTAVRFGADPAAAFDQSGSKLRATPGPGTASGPVGVDASRGTVTGPTYTIDPSPVPTIKSLSPKTAKAGKTVGVKGTGFWGTSSVQVNGVDVQSFTVKSDTNLKFVVAPGNTTGPVTVTTPGGTVASAATLTIS